MSFVRKQYSELGNEPMLVPPQLPPILAGVFDLKSINGSPSTEEVKLVHGAIRTLSSLLHTPELRDSDLPMELSQHLFAIQMVRHREKYPSGIFPNDIVYTPPSLPEHIPITLESVAGPPSDDQLRSVHAALRIMDSFANVPSVFDADLSMKLSQYLFDLQLARYIQRSTQTLASLPSTSPVLPDQGLVRVSTPHSNTTIETQGKDTDTRVAESRQKVPITESVSGDIQLPDDHRLGELPVPSELEHKSDQRETNRLLAEIRETLKNVNRVMIVTQNSLARGFNSTYWGSHGLSDLGAHSLLNTNGETPQMHGLPTLHNRNRASGSIHPDKLSMNVLARYLQFYGIGSEMIDDSGELTIKSGMEDDAKKVLKCLVYSHEG